MPRSILFLALLFYGLTAWASSESGLWSKLNGSQQQQLCSGIPVMIEEDIPNNPWPRFTVYHLTKASPSQVAAVFWDCERDPDYVPNCLSVRLLSCPQPWIHDGEYTLKMPFFLPDEVYVSRNEVKLISPEVYEISWKVLRSRYIKGCSGNLRLEPHGESTILCYSNLVMPGSRIATLLRTRAGNQVLGTVSSLVQQTEKEIAKNPTLMERQLHEMENSLAPAPRVR